MLPAVTPARIFEVGFGFFASKALLSAVELGVFDALAERPLDAAALRAKLGLHPRAVRDFLDALVALGLLDREGDGANGRYANTAETAAFLVAGSQGYAGGMLKMANARLYRFWGRLSEGLQSGAAQNEVRDAGTPDIFAALDSDPAALEAFVDAMGGCQADNFRLLAERFNFGVYRNSLDVGGSGAALSIALARRHAHLRCVSLDLEKVSQVATRRIADAGFADRIEARAGNFLTDALPKADVILMGNILHDWDLATKQMLLRKAWDALPWGGALFVVQEVIDDARRENAAALLMSLNMLIETPGGYNFSYAEFDEWSRAAGFERTEKIPLAGQTSALVAYR